MGKYINIEVSTLNGAILEKPYVQQFNCNLVFPQGIANVRDYDINNCIVVKTVFLLVENGNVFGTTEIATKQQFEQLRKASCTTCERGGCVISYNNCALKWDNCTLRYSLN